MLRRIRGVAEHWVVASRACETLAAFAIWVPMPAARVGSGEGAV